jgi:hypothetical protein
LFVLLKNGKFSNKLLYTYLFASTVTIILLMLEGCGRILPVGLNAVPASEDGAGDALLSVCFAQKRKIFKQIALHVFVCQ